MTGLEARRAELEAALADARTRKVDHDIELLETALKALGPVEANPGANPTSQGGKGPAAAGKGGSTRETFRHVTGVAGEGVKQLATTIPMLGELIAFGAKALTNRVFTETPLGGLVPGGSLGKDSDPFRVTRGVEEGIDRLIAPLRPDTPDTPEDRMLHRIGGAGVAGAASPALMAKTLRQITQGTARAAAAGMAGATGGEIATRAATHGMGGEVGGQAGENSGILPGIAGVAGSLAATLPFMWRQPPPNARELLAEALRGQDPRSFARAAENLRTVRSAGLRNWTPDQLFDEPGGLQQLTADVLRNAPADSTSFAARVGRLFSGDEIGPDLYRRVLGQPLESLTTAQAVGPRIGPSVPRSAAVRDMRQASEEALQSAKAPSKATKNLFGPDATQVPPETAAAITARLDELAATFRADKDASGLVQQLRDSLEGLVNRREIPVGTTQVTTLVRPETGKAAKHLLRTEQRPVSVEVNEGGQLGEFDTAINTFKDRAKRLETSLDASGISQATRGKVISAIREVQGLLDEVMTTRPQGRELVRAHREGVDRLTSSLLGRMAGRAGVDEALPDPTNLLSAWLPRFDAQQDIQTAAQTLRDRGRALAARNPGAADTELNEATRQAKVAVPQTARQLYDNAVSTAFNAGADASRASPAGGRRLKEELLSGQKGLNWRTLLVEATRDSATASGLPHDAVARGVEQVLRALEITSRGRDNSTVGHSLDLARKVNESELRSIFRMTQPLSQTEESSRLIREARTSGVYRDIAQILNRPDVLEQLAIIGNSPLANRRTATQIQAIVQTLQTPRRVESPPQEQRNAP